MEIEEMPRVPEEKVDQVHERVVEGNFEEKWKYLDKARNLVTDSMVIDHFLKDLRQKTRDEVSVAPGWVTYRLLREETDGTGYELPEVFPSQITILNNFLASHESEEDNQNGLYTEAGEVGDENPFLNELMVETARGEHWSYFSGLGTYLLLKGQANRLLPEVPVGDVIDACNQLTTEGTREEYLEEARQIINKENNVVGGFHSFLQRQAYTDGINAPGLAVYRLLSERAWDIGKDLPDVKTQQLKAVRNSIDREATRKNKGNLMKEVVKDMRIKNEGLVEMINTAAEYGGGDEVSYLSGVGTYLLLREQAKTDRMRERYALDFDE